MKLTFLTNAACIYESQGFKLLCDPWLTEGAFGSWVHDPPLKTKPEDVTGVDALYISHIHPDHLDEGTLAHFRRDIPIVTFKDRLSLTEKKLRGMGMTNVTALGDKQTLIHKSMSSPVNMECTVFGPFTKHPYHDCQVGNVVDSALLVQAGGVSVLNTNDNSFDLESAKAYVAAYGSPTVAQLNWNNAGPYPACFDNLTHAEKLEEAKRCLDRNLAHMLEVARVLDAKWTMPFAGAYKLGYGLEHLNQYLGTCPAWVAANYLEANGVRPLYLEEGGCFDLD